MSSNNVKILDLPVRTTSTYHFVPTTSYPFFKCFMSRDLLDNNSRYIITILNIYSLNSGSRFTLVITLFYSYQFTRTYMNLNDL